MAGNLIRTDEAAEMLGVRPGTLAIWRRTGRYGLAFVQIGRAIRYDPEDIRRFIEERKRGKGE